MSNNPREQAERGPRVAAVVVTYNRKAILRHCLQALNAQSRPLDEIIVIDNASVDGTGEMVRCEFPTVTYLRMAENLGGTGGFCKGILSAYEKAHDWIWVMDDDTVADGKALEALLRPELLADSSIYALATAVLDEDGSVNTAHRYIFEISIPTLRKIDLGCYEGAEFFATDTATFVGMLIRRDAVVEVGLPRKEFFIYADDAEYSLRIRSSGKRIVTVPASRIMDCNPNNYEASRCAWRVYYLRRNTLYTYKKYGDLGVAFYLRLLRSLVHAQLTIVRSDAHKYTSSKVLWLSTIHGLTGRLGKTMVPGDPIAERECNNVPTYF